MYLDEKRSDSAIKNRAEPGEFRVFVGASSVGGLAAQFQVM